jgi:hypothetical protein
MRGVFCCACAAVAAFAWVAVGAAAGPGHGRQHVLVIHPRPASPATVHIPVDPAAGPVQVETPDATVGFQLRRSPHVSATYTATPDGARELLTLASPDASSSFSYDLQMPVGVDARQLGPRAVAFVQAGTQIAVFVAPSMTDASGAVSRSLTVAVHGSTLTVTADRGWLARASYPVVVDPDLLTMQGASQDTYIESGSPGTYFGGDPQLLVGDDGSQAIRGLLNFDLDTAVPAGSTIDSAQLSLNLESASTSAASDVTVSNVVDSWSDATWTQYDWDWHNAAPLLWNTPGGDTDTTGAPTAAASATPGSTSWDVTQLVQRQVSGLDPSYGFELQQQGEATTQVLAFTSSWSRDGTPLPTLTVTYEDASSSATGPAVTLLGGNSVYFGSAGVGSTTPTQEVDVENSGSAPLHIAGLSLAGANPGDFAILNTTCSAATVQAGDWCSIVLSATPSAAGNRAATLIVTDDATNSPQNVALTVTGTTAAPAAATVAPSRLSFGTVRVGKTSSTQYVTVKSSGGVPLTVSSVTTTGDFAVVSNTCTNAQLAPGSSCRIGVRAHPLARGTRTGTLSIADNATGGASTVALTVTGG